MNSKTKTTATKEEASPTLVPKLRFPEFRGAGGWEQKEVGEVFQVTRGDVLSMTLVQDEKSDAMPYPVYSSQTKNNGLSGYYSDFLFEDAITWTTDGANAGDVNFRTGKFFCTNVCGVLLNSKGFANPCIAALINRVSTKYVSYVGNPKLMNGVMSKIPIPVPSLAEQQKIAECLSSVDELIAAQARKLDALKTHKKGLMQQLFPREGETQPRLRFPEFQNAGEWVESPLSKFILSLDAGVSVNSGDSRPADKTEFGVLKTSAITKGQFDPEENKVVFAESELSRLREPVIGGTIIMCRKNTPALVGANAYIESTHENLFLPDLLWAAKPREGVSMRFLAFILGSDKGRAALSKLAKGSSASMSNITKPEVLAFSVMAPFPAEQQRIADCLTRLDDLIAAQTQTLEALKTHKQGLMQQLFPAPSEVDA